MPSLKTFRLRIRSVQSTQKITKAMKMVAASRLRRAQEQAMAVRPYAEAMDKVMATLALSFKGGVGPKLLAGTGSDNVHLLIVATADRGLCGALNSSIVREARRTIRALQADGKTVKVLAVGRKARDQLRRDYASLIIETITELGRPRVSFADAQKVIDWLVKTGQNYFQWPPLRTLDFPSWSAHVRRILDYAHARGVKVGWQAEAWGGAALQNNVILMNDTSQPPSTMDALCAPIQFIHASIPFFCISGVEFRMAVSNAAGSAMYRTKNFFIGCPPSDRQ